MKETPVKAALLKVVTRKHQAHFLQILTTAADRMNRSAALTGRKSTPLNPLKTYSAHRTSAKRNVSAVMERGNRDPSPDESPGPHVQGGQPRHRQQIWEELKTMGVYAAKKHLRNGEPWKLSTEDMLPPKYLESPRCPAVILHATSSRGGARAPAETTRPSELAGDQGQDQRDRPQCLPKAV